jgi:hypothetical protein
MNPALRDLFVAVLFLVMVVFMMASNQRQESMRGPLQRVTGTVVEVDTTGFSGRDPALRLRLSGYTTDFRMSPEYVERHLDGTIPATLRAGAAVEIWADSRLLQTPAQPALGPAEGIVWIRGLVVGGRVLLSPADADAFDDHNDRWGVLTLLVAVGAVAYTARKWKRQRKVDDVT